MALIMSPVGVWVAVCCAKATWQNDRARTNRNAADLLSISSLHSRQALDLYDIWIWILSSNNFSLTCLKTLEEFRKK
jgi:hypothetical protein